jgi:hypothetical protein
MEGLHNKMSRDDPLVIRYFLSGLRRVRARRHLQRAEKGTHPAARSKKAAAIWSPWSH